MKKNFIYRIASLTLALSFSLFNVGIPVILASCPMMDARMSNAPCCTSQNDNSTTGLRASGGSNCCKTVFLAERNTTEFVQFNFRWTNIVHPSPIIIPIVLAMEFGEAAHPVPYNSGDTSPPFSRDIPLIVSSLLI